MVEKMNKMTEEKKRLIREWYRAQEELASAKERETHLRKLVVSDLVGDDPMAGTSNFELSDQHKLTISIGTTYDVDKELFRDNYVAMKNKGLIGDTSVIVMKPSVSATAFKYMNDEDKAQFGHVFRVKTGSPSVKVVARKE